MKRQITTIYSIHFKSLEQETEKQHR